jgi:hypothetical protein
MMAAMGTDSLRFAATARRLAEVARGEGLSVPGFRSPPRLPGVDRSLRRRLGGRAVVAVRLRGRSHGAVVADMVEGVVVANRLTGAEAARVRAALSEAAGVAPAAPEADRAVGAGVAA